MTTLKYLRIKYSIRLRLYYRSAWARGAYRSERPLIVIGGCERSGTTLLRATMDCHSQIAAGPEAWVFVYKPDLPFLSEEYGIPLEELQEMRSNSKSLAQFIDRFADWCCESQSKPIWCEKSPQNINRLDYIWEHFPKARVIHLIRDARDVVCSLRHHPRRKRVNGEYVPNKVTNPIYTCVDKWVTAVSNGIRHRGDERYMEVRYEDLIDDYKSISQKICKHCGVEWDEKILNRESIQSQRSDVEIVNPEVRKPLYTSAVGRWRKDLNAKQQDQVIRHAGELLSLLNYPDV